MQQRRLARSATGKARIKIQLRLAPTIEYRLVVPRIAEFIDTILHVVNRDDLSSGGAPVQQPLRRGLIPVLPIRSRKIFTERRYAVMLAGRQIVAVFPMPPRITRVKSRDIAVVTSSHWRKVLGCIEEVAAPIPRRSWRLHRKPTSLKLVINACEKRTCR